ncbi:MAG: hypothetical protein RIR00_504 [Pseudomonadota bacterium]|jgi:hypothetical protein
MLFQPAIIALLLVAGTAVLLLALVTPGLIELLRHWDLSSGSSRQLRLERRTYLYSTLTGFVLAAQGLALLLFVFTADRLALRFVGAMCAVGTLNVNPWGFPALGSQVAVFFAASLWLILNHLDNQARQYPLIRLKYGLLLGLLPLLVLNLVLQWRFFSGLKAQVITSCCGSLFSGEARTLAAELSALPPQPAMLLSALGLGLVLLLAAWHRRDGGRASACATALAGALAFAAGLLAVLSYLSLYLYEHPHHHCPFCLLKPEYHYQGYALYLPLFVASVAALGTGLVRACAGRPGLALLAPRLSRRLAGVALAGYSLFALLAALAVWQSRLILIE